MKMNKKGFTLIELLAVIVILAIIALIATPIVMNVINEAQEGADARSVETYGKEVESLYYQKLIKEPGFEKEKVGTLTSEVSVSGNEVSCTGTIGFNDVSGDEVLEINTCTVTGGSGKTFNYSSKTGATCANCD